MTIRIVRLGTKRSRGEGLRIGTVRRPPRGVPKTEYASQNWYDVWLPNVAPSPELMKRGRAADQRWSGLHFSKNIAQRWPILKRVGFSICLPRCHIMQTSL